MAKIHAKNCEFIIANTSMEDDGNSVVLDIPVDTAEVTSFSDTYKTYTEGLASWTVSYKGYRDQTASHNDQILFDLIGSDGALLEIHPEGSADTKVYYSGSALLTSYHVESAIDGPVICSADFQGTGTLTRATTVA